MKKIFIGILLVVASIGLFFRLNSKNNLPDEKELFSKFPGGYETKTVKVGDLLIGYITENTKSVINSETGCVSDQTPIVYLIKEGLLKQVYEINMGNLCTWNERFVAFDVDNDGTEEIISEWEGYAGGSGGPKALVIWKADEKKGFLPFIGYPEEMSKDKGGKLMEIKDLKTGQVSNFPMASFNDFIDFRLQTPESFRLLYGTFIWDFEADESHLGPHFWELSVFKFANNKFVKDESWNNGKKYKTKDKIPVDDEGFKKIKELFDSI